VRQASGLSEPGAQAWGLCPVTPPSPAEGSDGHRPPLLTPAYASRSTPVESPKRSVFTPIVWSMRT
jgi:hypothetical protein